MDLFTDKKNEIAPLSKRMCPTTIDEFFGQEHIVGEGKLLRRAIEADRINSVIFYGPPGIGKTALAMVISRSTGASFIRKNAVSSNVIEIRKIIETAKKYKLLNGTKTILLLDEIHRFNKAQQDVLLPEVEEENIILIGTTTENPYFSVNSALLSRSQIFEFNTLNKNDIFKVIKNALENKENGLGLEKIKISDEAIELLSNLCNGDARKALNALEIAFLTTKKDKEGIINISEEEIQESIQKRAVVYDKDGDGHYDTVSAYIKSMRGSDPDAALYWLAKMIEAGESLRFIARRLVICASEDVGNADPRALMVAVSAKEAADFVGYPEARIILAQATAYVACAPKSNASILAIDKAIEDIKKERTQEVPKHLKDAHYSNAKELGNGVGYKYAHSYENNYVKQDYLENKKQYYFPTDNGYEKKIKEWLKQLTKNNEDEDKK